MYALKAAFQSMLCTFLITISLIATVPQAKGDPAPPTWTEGMFPFVGAWNNVYAVKEFDDGTGLAIYAAGELIGAGKIRVSGIVKWDGNDWSDVGGGIEGEVNALEVFDDGTGLALYAAGNFTVAGGHIINSIAKWDGTSWSQLGNGIFSNRDLFAMIVFDDGNGSALYVSGRRFNPVGLQSNSIARWDGTVWSEVDGLIDGEHRSTVYALEIFDNGSGPALYLAGEFTMVGELPANNIARWDGVSWSALNEGITQGRARALGLYDDGKSEKLIVGGSFGVVDGEQGYALAMWDGLDWSLMGDFIFNDRVLAIKQVTFGNESPLLIGGYFRDIGEVVVYGLAQWDGTEWSTIGVSPYASSVWTFETVQRNGELCLAVGGVLWERGNIATWDGSEWGSFTYENAFDFVVTHLQVLDTGEGEELYAAGLFSEIGEQTDAHGLAKFNGREWTILGVPGMSTINGFIGPTRKLVWFDDGSGTGPALFAGGGFDELDGVTVNNIAKRVGDTWVDVGGGVTHNKWPNILDMEVFQDELYVGGGFDHAGEIATHGIARWNGSNWSDVGGGLGGETYHIYSMVIADDGSGSGPSLYIAGKFFGLGKSGATKVAQWNGTEWLAMGSPDIGLIYDIIVFDDGSGDALYIGGNSEIDSNEIGHVQKWNGSDWVDVGSYFTGEYEPQYERAHVYSMVSHDDGTGDSLYALGMFQANGAQSVLNIAEWTGIEWIPMEEGLNDQPHRYNHSAFSAMAAASFDDHHGGKALYVGGDFFFAGSHVSARMARWGGPIDRTTAPLTRITVLTGELIDGEIADLLYSNDTYIHLRSGLGNTLVDLHNMEISILAEAPGLNPTTIDLTIESSIDEPSGLAQIRMKNFNTTDFDVVGSYSIGNTDAVEVIAGLEASRYYNTNNGRMRVKIKHMVFVPFLAFTFESFVDQVEISVN